MNQFWAVAVMLGVSGCDGVVAPSKLEVTYKVTAFADHVHAEAHFEERARKGPYGIALADAQRVRFGEVSLPVTHDDPPFHFDTVYSADLPTLPEGAAFILKTPGAADVVTPVPPVVFSTPVLTQSGATLVITAVPQPHQRLTVWSRGGCFDTRDAMLDDTGIVSLSIPPLTGPCAIEASLDIEHAVSLRGAFSGGFLTSAMHATAQTTLLP